MFKFLWKKFKKEILFATILLVGIILLLNRLNQFGFALIIGAVLMYLFLQSQKHLPSDIKRLKQQLANQEKEIDDLKSRKLNVTGLKHILEISLIEIDTHFTRTWNEKYTWEKKDLQFIGALQIKLKAKYGINLKDLLFSIDNQTKTIYITGLHPKFLSFSEINHEWKIAELMEYKKRPWIISNYWKKSDKFQEILHLKMEEKRKLVYMEVQQGPEEIKWMLEPLYQQVENTMRILLNKNDFEIEFIRDDLPQMKFIPLEEYLQKPDNLVSKNGIISSK